MSKTKKKKKLTAAKREERAAEHRELLGEVGRLHVDLGEE